MVFTRKKIGGIAVFAFVCMFILFSTSSCKKDKLLTIGGALAFSTDTLRFDTVFTTIGSVTRQFKIYNKNNKRIKLSEIKLERGQSSPFRLNVDGVATKSIRDVEIAGNDSLYIFVALTVDPTTGVLPFLVEDKVLFELNGTTRDVPLEAFGQDAHYIYNDSVLTTQTWVNDKPYVIIHSAIVDSANTLTIQKGCRIYMHQDSKLYVLGSLKAFGTKADSIIFQGDRLDRDYFGYRDYPGEWGGILFYRSSSGNNLNYCTIKNAGNTTDGFTSAAINVLPYWVDLGGPMLEMNYCTISNSLTFGLVGFTARVRMNSCLINTCGQQNVACIEGGDYEFTNCTMANYGGLGINHTQQPVLAALNYRDISLTEFVTADLKANFKNCIIYGSLDNEVFFNKRGSAVYNVTLQNCLYKLANQLDPSLVSQSNCLRDQDPQFKEISKWNFRIPNTSPAKGAGIASNIPPYDLDFKNWGTPPSIGCYEAE